MSKRIKKLQRITTDSDVCDYLRTSPNAILRQNGSHLTAECADTGMRHTATDHHRELAPGLRRDIIRAIIACGFTCIVIAMLAYPLFV